jgi:predicted nucleotidyltransferase
VNEACPIAPELRSIVLKTQGVGKILQEKLHSLDAVRKAFIYGSFAAGTADIHSDIDLMIIGEINLEEISGAISEAERDLNRPINYLIFSEEEWKEKLAIKDPFAVNVDESTKIMLIGGEDAL